jgi:hypothetical protein
VKAAAMLRKRCAGSASWLMVEPANSAPGRVPGSSPAT